MAEIEGAVSRPQAGSPSRAVVEAAIQRENALLETAKVRHAAPKIGNDLRRLFLRPALTPRPSTRHSPYASPIPQVW